MTEHADRIWAAAQVLNEVAETEDQSGAINDLLAVANALRSTPAAPQPKRPSATWRPADRTVLVAMAPIVDGLCSGCGTKPSRETGSCRCLFRIDDVIREEPTVSTTDDDRPEPGEPQHVVPLPDEGHILIDLVCWCGPYRDAVEPEVIIHRKAAEA